MRIILSRICFGCECSQCGFTGNLIRIRAATRARKGVHACMWSTCILILRQSRCACACLHAHVDHTSRSTSLNRVVFKIHWRVCWIKQSLSTVTIQIFQWNVTMYASEPDKSTHERDCVCNRKNRVEIQFKFTHPNSYLRSWATIVGRLNLHTPHTHTQTRLDRTTLTATRDSYNVNSI